METQTNVQVISTITIKPSTPTLHSNRNLKLSLLDQLMPPIYGCIVLFYSVSNTSSISKNLQKSLSETLVHFYPFAGRVKDNSYIECSDQGACFVEAKAESKLSDFLRKPDPDLLRQLLPIPVLKDFGNTNDHGDPILLVQLTLFSCRGIAIAVSILHKIGDAQSLSTFMNSWSSVSRLNLQVVSLPDFVGPCLLPPQDNLPIMTITSNHDSRSWATRRFVFHISKLETLKAELANAVEFKPSNVELVSAILFTRLLAAPATFRPAALKMAVNLRPKMTPPLPENTVGNHIWPVSALAEQRGDIELHLFVSRLRKELMKFYNEKASKFKGEDGLQMVFVDVKKRAELLSGLSVYNATSLCKFRFYEMDFGWGNPTWMTSPLFVPMTLVLTNMKSGDGIEVWATLNKEVMAILEQDEELLTFASLNPSIITDDAPYSRM